MNAQQAKTLSPAAASRRFWPALLAICLVGAGLRVFILLEYLAENPLAYSPRIDALTYWGWAGRIAAGQLRETTPFFSAPLYPYLVGLIRACGGSFSAVYAIQILMDVCTAALLGWLGRARFGPVVGLLAAALYLALLDPASFGLRVLTCSLQLLLICIAWIGLLAVQRRGSWRRALLAGAALGLLSLSYPPAMVLLVALGPWLWWNSPRRWADCGRAVLAVLAGAVLIAPATLHNYLASGNFFPIQSVTAVNFRQGNSPGAQGVITMIPGTSRNRETLFSSIRADYRRDAGHEGTWAEINAYYRDQALDYWRADPWHTMKLFARKAYWFLTGRHYGDIYLPTLEMVDGLTGRLRLASLPTAWLIPPALVTLIAMLRKPNQHFPELMLAVIPFLIVVAFWYSPRYRLPAIPVITVAAAWALWRAAQWRSFPWWSAIVATSLALGIGLGAVNRATGFDPSANLRPSFEQAVGLAFAAQGNSDQAIERYRLALEHRPNYPSAQLGLAQALHSQGRLDEAIKLARHIIASQPDNAVAHNTLALALSQQDQLDEATQHFREVIRLRPGLAAPHTALAAILTRQGKLDEALQQLQTALDLDPESASTYARLGEALLKRGQFTQAAEMLRQAYGRSPNDVSLANNLAWLLATCPDAEVRNGAEAVRIAGKIDQGGDHRTRCVILDTLAAAHAEAGQYDQAVRIAQQGLVLATAAGQTTLAREIRTRLELYEQHLPYHEPSAP